MKIKLIALFALFIAAGIGLGLSSALLYQKWFVQEQPQREKPFVAFQHTVTPTTGRPFLLGFTSLEQESMIKKLKIDGKIPSWLHGTFISIGPGKFEVKESRASHWLDGFAMIHRFSIENGSVGYANKLIQTNYLQEALKKGVITGTTPSQDQSKWSKLRSALSSSNRPVYDNVNINVFSLGSELMALTETPQHICLDCHTLETKQPIKFNDKLDAHFSSGHPLFDPSTREWYNVGIQYGMHSSYVVYKIPADSKQRIVIATIKQDKPAYIHSFALSKHYIIITEIPLRVSPYDLVMGSKSFIDTHQWNPKGNTIFTVINRQNGNVVGTFKTHPFFALHHVNAFDQDHTVTLDIVTYKDPSILKSLGFDHLYHADVYHFPLSTLERFELNLSNKKVTDKVLSSKNIEMPQINYQHYGMQPYTYVYGVHLTSSEQLANQIIKMNVKTGAIHVWQDHDCYPSEPIFIASPQAKAEDDGVVLCVILDSKHRNSFLLVLDAKTMKELGRAQVPHHIPFTVHSSFMNPIK